MAMPNDIKERREKAEKLIYDVLDAADVTHSNSDYYKEVEKTANYIEIYLPDSVYTYPTELDDLSNESPTIRGASKKNPKRTDENGETIKGLSRIVKKNTAVILIFIDGKADPGNIKCIGKFDDYEEERILNGANTGGITRTTSESATRTATSTGTAKARGSNGRRQSGR